MRIKYITEFNKTVGLDIVKDYYSKQRNIKKIFSNIDDIRDIVDFSILRGNQFWEIRVKKGVEGGN